MQKSGIKIPVIAVVGPTASGKTALSIELAKRLHGEIISCDSMQVYRGMDIGTAKPDEEERGGVPHHMIDIVDPDIEYNCSDYAEAAVKSVYDIFSRGKLPIFCGGTGLYLDSVLRGVRDDGAEKDPKFRDEMTKFALENGNAALHSKLREVDPDAADAIHPNNVRRVVRALEIFHTTGKTKTSLDEKSRQISPLFSPLIIGLTYGDRDILYKRIDERVDKMFEKGLEDEVRGLLEKGFLSENTTAGQAIGYKETAKFIRGEISLEEASEQIKLSTRHYAKRQITWLSAKKDIVPLMMTKENGQTESFEEITHKALALAFKHGFNE